MSNNINWGKIYESTAWGSGVTDNNISWGKSYADLAGGGSGFDADYQAVLDQSTSLGYTAPSAAQQTLQNTLVTDLKTAGVWDKLDLFYVFATDGDSDYATLNWKAPSSHQTTKVNSPTFTSNEGFNGDLTSSYLDTNFQLDSIGLNSSLNSVSFGGYKHTRRDLFGTYFSCEMGIIQTSPSVVGTHFNGNGGQRVNNSASNGFMPESQIDSGVFSLIRNQSTEFKQYKNSLKTASTSVSVVSSAIPQGLNMFVLARNVQGSANQFSNDTLSVIYFGADITNEYSDFVDALDNYMNAL